MEAQVILFHLHSRRELLDRGGRPGLPSNEAEKAFLEPIDNQPQYSDQPQYSEQRYTY